MRIGLTRYNIGVSIANDRANRFARIALRIARATKSPHDKDSSESVDDLVTANLFVIAA